jgi:hypothetical protein
VNEARRLRTLEHENTRLKRLVADLTLDNQARVATGEAGGMTQAPLLCRRRTHTLSTMKTSMSTLAWRNCFSGA